MLNWKLIGAVAVLVLGLLAFGCSDSNSDDGDDSEPEATEMDDSGDEPADDEEAGDAPSGGGIATLTIGGETWEFEGYRCAFGPEETQNEDVDFSSTAFGESATGAATQMSVDITLGTHAVSLNDIDDFENPSVAWEAIGGFEIQMDGKNISAEATFDDGTTPDVLEETPGTFDGTCP